MRCHHLAAGMVTVKRSDPGPGTANHSHRPIILRVGRAVRQSKLSIASGTSVQRSVLDVARAACHDSFVAAPS